MSPATSVASFYKHLETFHNIPGCRILLSFDLHLSNEFSFQKAQQEEAKLFFFFPHIIYLINFEDSDFELVVAKALIRKNGLYDTDINMQNKQVCVLSHGRFTCTSFS